MLLSKHGLYVDKFAQLYQEFHESCKCQHARVPVQGPREVGGFTPTPRFPPLTHVAMDFASLPTSTEETGGFVGVGITAC